MNRWLLIGSLAGLLIASTGCLHHNTRGGCSTGNCETGGCNTGSCGGSCGSGILGKLKGGGCNGSCGSGNCGSGNCGHGGGLCKGGCRAGCVAGPIGWQQGGLDYSSHLQPGLLGHNAARNLNNRPFTPGPPTAQTAYPYYTVRSPRDFLMDKPPTIGR